MTDEPISAALQVFDFEGKAKIRVFDIDGCRMAVGSDICTVLDLRDAPASLKRLDHDDKITIRRSDTTGSTRGIWEEFAPQVQTVILITEDGAVDLVLQSRKPEAKAFYRFLTHVVWKAIRETGAYIPIPQDYPAALRAHAQAVLAHASAYEAKAVAEAKVLELEGTVEILGVKGRKYDRYIDHVGYLDLDVVALKIGWGKNLLRAMMRDDELKILKNGGSEHNLPYGRYQHKFKTVGWSEDLPGGKVLTGHVALLDPNEIDWLAEKVGPFADRPKDLMRRARRRKVFRG